MKLLIVTGMSGAGKSQAANILEDMGFYCVDNIPPAIIPSLVDLSRRGNEELGRLAIVTDIRGGDLFDGISAVLENLKNDKVDCKILFLDAPDEVLIRRYKENRRKHPLCDKGEYSLSDAVKQERKLLSKIRFAADFIVDTGNTSTVQLKARLSEIFLKNNKVGMTIQCKSFGFKYGSDPDADIIIDVRCLPNPFYVEELKKKTGLDPKVSNYVMQGDNSQEFLKRVLDFIDFSLPLYTSEGKSQLVISFGCTGGKHRSVTFAETLYKHLCQLGYNVGVIHRDIHKN